MKRENVLLYLLATVNFTNIMDVMIIMPLGNQLMNTFSINPQQFSLIVSVYSFSAFFSGLIAASYVDRFDRKSAILFVYAGFALGTIACALAPSYLFLLIARSLTGLFGGIIGALVLAIVSDLFSYERRGKAMGILISAFSAASVLGVPMGLFFASRFSWHAPFWIIGGLGTLLWVVLALNLKPMRAHIDEERAPKSPLKVFYQIVQDSNQVNALVLTFILILGHFFIIPFIAPYMERNIGFTPDQITLVYVIGGLLTVFSSPLIGRLTDRFGALRMYFMILGISFIPVILITHLQTESIILAISITSTFFVFGSGRMIPAQTMVTAAVSPEHRGSFMSFRSSILQLGAGIASIVGGLIVVESESGLLEQYTYLGYLSVAFCLLTVFFAPKLKVARGN
ncbi:MAG: MFS transporter [Bacteroidota bacterium]